MLSHTDIHNTNILQAHLQKNGDFFIISSLYVIANTQERVAFKF